MKNNTTGKKLPQRTAWYGYAVLLLGILSFSGVFQTLWGGTLRMLDFQTLLGTFGVVGGTGSSVDFRGVGGTGVKDGFLLALSLCPTEMFALAVIAVIEQCGGLNAAQKILTPLLRPILGVNGRAGLAVVSSLQSTDAGAGMTADLWEKGFVSGRERNILAAFQFTAGALLANYFVIGAALFPVLEENGLNMGWSVLLVIAAKLISANLIRWFSPGGGAKTGSKQGSCGAVDEQGGYRSLMDAFLAGANKGWKISITSTIPNVMLAFAVIRFLDLSGVLNLISHAFAPIMGLAGLPGAAAMVYFSSLLSGAGASGTAVSLYLSGELTAVHCAILFPAILIMTGSVQYLGRVLETAKVNRNMYVVCFLLNMLLGFAALVVMNLLL